MNSQERFEPNILQENQELEEVSKFYLEMIALGHQTALNFLNQPANNFNQMSERKKAKQIAHILKDKQGMDIFLKEVDDITCCAFYASFIATFSQYMNPNNETIIFFGGAKISASPKKDEIGTKSDHFWTTINGRVFDNSKIVNTSYTDLKPELKINGIASGNFQFEKIS